MKAFILAAGLGTRLVPYTNFKPKALVKVNGTPMLELLINRLISYGVNYIVINVHHFGDQIIDFVKRKNFYADIHISDERNLLLNTGGGILNVKKFFKPGDNFIVHNVDIYSEINLSKFYEWHLKNDNLCSLAVSHRKSTNYLLFNKNMNLCGWKSYKTNTEIISRNENTFDEQAFSGIYILNYNFFDLLKNDKKSFPIIPKLLKISENYDIKGYNHDNVYLLDLGKYESILALENYLKK